VAEKKTKPIPAKKLSFSDAVAEVEDILSTLERENVEIDTLGEQVKRAVELNQVCRHKLTTTEGEVRDLVAGLQDDTVDEDSAGDTPF